MQQANSETIQRAAHRLLNKQQIRNHPYIIYRLNRNLELPFEVLLNDKVLGLYSKDLKVILNALSQISYIKVCQSCIRLCYRHSNKTVLVTGLITHVVQRSANCSLQKEDLCISITCQSRQEAENLCLFLRECKRQSQFRRQIIKPNEYCKIRISIESGRLQSLFTEYVEKKRQKQFVQNFGQLSKKVLIKSAIDHIDDCYRKNILTTVGSTGPDSQYSVFSDDEKKLQTHTAGDPQKQQDLQSDEGKKSDTGVIHFSDPLTYQLNDIKKIYQQMQLDQRLIKPQSLVNKAKVVSNSSKRCKKAKMAKNE